MTFGPAPLMLTLACFHVALYVTNKSDKFKRATVNTVQLNEPVCEEKRSPKGTTAEPFSNPGPGLDAAQCDQRSGRTRRFYASVFFSSRQPVI